MAPSRRVPAHASYIFFSSFPPVCSVTKGKLKDTEKGSKTIMILFPEVGDSADVCHVSVATWIGDGS